jgi:hypothetical protein
VVGGVARAAGKNGSGRDKKGEWECLGAKGRRWNQVNDSGGRNRCIFGKMQAAGAMGIAR